HPSPGMESTPGPTDWPRESDGIQEPATGEVQTGPRDLAGRPSDALPASWEDLARLARRMGAFPVTAGNQVALYYDGQSAFDAMLEAIRSARHHIHLETFIFQPDGTGRLFLDALTQKARAGVEIRLLYDAMGTRRLTRKLLRSLRAAGGACSVFLPINPFR